MALLDKVKKVAVEMSNVVIDTVKDVAEQAAKKAAERTAEKAAKLAAEEQKRLKEAEDSGYYIRDGKMVIGTMDGMKTYLKELGKDTTPAIMQTLQTQLQILNYVQSPSLTGMASNCVFCGVSGTFLSAAFNCQDPASSANVGLGVAWMIY